MRIPFIALILQGIPETIAIVTLSFIIAKIPLQWKKIVLIGVVIALTSYVIRMFPVTFGIHTILLISLLFIFLIKLGRSSINTALIASLLSYLAIILAETACVSILMPVFGVTPEVLFTNTTVRILISYPQVLVMFMLSYILFKIRAKKEGSNV